MVKSSEKKRRKSVEPEEDVEMAKSSDKKRMSSEKKRRKSVEPEEDVEINGSDTEMKDSPEQGESSTNSGRKKGSSARELRRQRRDQADARNTGVGISKDNAPTGKKIIFGDDVIENDDKVEKEETPADDEDMEEDDEKVQEEGGDDDDDDDDDAVEEVNTAAAREHAQEERGREHATARAAVSVKSRRKRKKQAESEPAEDAAENEFDDDFFAQLDEEMTEEQKQEKEKRKLAQPKGRHTTFVVPDEDENGTSAPVGHNIEVTVLGETDSRPSDPVILNTDPSETAVLFSRNRLDNGSDGVSAKQLQKAKRSGKKNPATPSWKRSKKMNLLLAPGARSKRLKEGQGRAAAHFVVEA
jgi:hypothetical protein